MKVLFEPIPEHATPRKCSNCQRPAARWRFKMDQSGAKNPTSRVAVCDEHSGKMADDAIGKCQGANT